MSEAPGLPSLCNTTVNIRFKPKYQAVATESTTHEIELDGDVLLAMYRFFGRDSRFLDYLLRTDRNLYTTYMSSLKK